MIDPNEAPSGFIAIPFTKCYMCALNPLPVCDHRLCTIPNRRDGESVMFAHKISAAIGNQATAAQGMNFVTVSTHALAKRILEHPYGICGSLHHLAEAQRPKRASYIDSKDLSHAAACLIRDTMHVSIDDVPSGTDDPARETLRVVADRSRRFEYSLVPARRVFARFRSMQPDRLVAIPVRAYDHRQQVLLAIEAHNAVASRIIAEEDLFYRRVPGGAEADNEGSLILPTPNSYKEP